MQGNVCWGGWSVAAATYCISRAITNIDHIVAIAYRDRQMHSVYQRYSWILAGTRYSDISIVDSGASYLSPCRRRFLWSLGISQWYKPCGSCGSNTIRLSTAASWDQFRPDRWYLWGEPPAVFHKPSSGALPRLLVRQCTRWTKRNFGALDFLNWRQQLRLTHSAAGEKIAHS